MTKRERGLMERDAARWRAVRVGGRVYMPEHSLSLFVPLPTPSALLRYDRMTIARSTRVTYGRLADVYADAYADHLVEAAALASPRPAKPRSRRKAV